MDKQKKFEKIFKEHLKVETYSKSIDSLYSRRNISRINYKPYYQRNYVWDTNKASYFIESILLGTEIPPLIFFDNNDCTEVIDGRQRFETIYRFMNNEFSLSKKGLTKLKQLKGANWDSFAKENNDILESFLDAKLRIIEFKLVNEPPLDKFLEDQVKKEIFSRYNSGITPLKKAEIDNAIYDEDQLTNYFKDYFEDNPEFKLLVYKTFFKQLKNEQVEVPLEKVMSFIRRFLVLPSFPINYYTRGSERTEILSKLYEYFSDDNIDNYDEVIRLFVEKVKFIHEILEYSKSNSLNINRLAIECFLWGFGVMELEEVEFNYDEQLKIAISNYISRNIEEYSDVDHAFAKQIMTRYLATAIFFEERYNLDLGIYINADDVAKAKIKEMKKPEETLTKLSELESLRLNKPEPANNSIDDIIRVMNRRKFMIRPSYQRKEVINPKKASSIIESVLLGIKLPPIFIYKRKNGINEVIDGQQRLLTLLGFIGSHYVNEKNNQTFSKNHNFALRNLRILNELDKNKFTDLDQKLQDKIYDFQLYVVEIDESQNPEFEPIDLFIRLNDKPYPIRENSFEMWNSWADIEIIQKIKDLKNKLYPWFYLKQIKTNKDRDRMENEELLTSLCYIEYYKDSNNVPKTIDLYQKTGRINSRISTKARISALMQSVTENEEIKQNFEKALKNTNSFIKKVKYVLLDQDKSKDELDEYLKQELDKIFKAGKKSSYFRRTIQDFYFLWLILGNLNFEMVKFHRLEMKKEIYEIFKYIKNIPEEHWQNNQGLNQFNSMLKSFSEKYSQKSRKTKLSENEKLEFIQKQNNKSSITGAPIFLGDDIEVDHVEPLAIGGSDTKDNLAIAHSDENRTKGAKYK